MKPTYTPEKIDEFVANAKKDVEAAKSLFTLAVVWYTVTLRLM